MEIPGAEGRLGLASLVSGIVAMATWLVAIITAALMIPNGEPTRPTALVLVVATGLTVVGPLSAVAAVVSGHVARRMNSKRDAALIGLVLGYTYIAMVAAFIVFMAVSIVQFSQQP